MRDAYEDYETYRTSTRLRLGSPGSRQPADRTAAPWKRPKRNGFNPKRDTTDRKPEC